MAVQRQQNWLGQQRVDIPHARAIESGVAHDFDVLGQGLAGRLASVIKGFTLVRTGAVGADAEDLVMQVAGAMCIHYEATEAGSIFRVEDSRANEVLGPTNERVKGAFTPGATNYVGLDLVRTADDTTADSAQFLVPSSGAERARDVPMARSMDYRIMVSTTEFGSTLGVCPLAQVVTDASNRVVSIADARHLMWRLGVGGTTPSAVSPFAWPGGRNESDPGTADIAGDRSIFNLKEWMSAAMTRIWETGGGEFWYSLTADRNVKVTSTATFASTQEAFEWTGTNVHWQALTIKFDNSNGVTNTVAAQLGNSAGLTDLADGQCIYVDLSRTANGVVVPARGTLQTLGGSTRPGQRWVLAWRVGAAVFIRDQAGAVGTLHAAASFAVRGTVKLTADPDDVLQVANPRVPLALDISGDYIATCAGISHNIDVTSNGTGPGIILIGRGALGGDTSVVLSAEGIYSVQVAGDQRYDTAGEPAMYVTQNDTDNAVDPGDNKTLVLAGKPAVGTPKWAQAFEAGGAVGFRNVLNAPQTPSPTATKPIRSKWFFRTNGLASPNTKDQCCIMGWDGAITPIWESNPY